MYTDKISNFWAHESNTVPTSTNCILKNLLYKESLCIYWTRPFVHSVPSFRTAVQIG